MHDDLVQRLRRRQRNIVFPDTVRNQGIFFRNLAGESIHAFTSHRIFAAFWGLYLLAQYLVLPAILGFGLLALLASLVASSLWIAIGLKVTVNASRTFTARASTRPSAKTVRRCNYPRHTPASKFEHSPSFREISLFSAPVI